MKDSDGKPLAGREVTVVLPDGSTVPGTTDENGKIIGKDSQPISFVAQDSGDVKVFDGTSTEGGPLATARVSVKDNSDNNGGSDDNNGGNTGNTGDNGSHDGGNAGNNGDNSGKNNGGKSNSGKNTGSSSTSGNQGVAQSAQQVRQSAQVLASTGAAVTAIVALALAFISAGVFALAARRRQH